MLELRRVRAGIFTEDTIVNLYDFEKAVDEYKNGNDKLLRAMIIPGEIVSEVYPILKVEEKEIKRLWTGKPIFKDDVIGKTDFKKDEVVSVFAEDKFLGMYKIIDGKDIFAKGEFVFQPI